VGDYVTGKPSEKSEKEALAASVAEVREAWEAVIAELGHQGLERPVLPDGWRVRDVLAHFNGWDRWQLVQLRCAFTGETPTDEELSGGIEFPPNDDMQEDAMNAMFLAGNRDRTVDEIVGDWREISAIRAEWVADASQEQLDTDIGGDWTSGTNRIFRLASEVPTVNPTEHVWERIVDQIEHQKEHLKILREHLESKTGS
jgi:hypothetical protein